MKNNKSINIYMGIIGEAYVDKETAYAVLLAAKKNILDVQAIIEAANALQRPLIKAQIAAQTAITASVRVYNNLKNAISLFEESDPKFAKLYVLLSDLNENDFDDNFSNGGNIFTARENLTFAQSLESEIHEILVLARDLLDANKLNAVVRCKEYNIAKELFEAMIPEKIVSPEDISNTMEAELLKRINAVRNNIDYVNLVSDEIITISDEVDNKIDKIVSGTDENTKPSNETLYWYAGNKCPYDDESFMEDLGFTLDVNAGTYVYKETLYNGDGTKTVVDVDFGIDGPLRANKWFHHPLHLIQDGQLIAGVDGGKAKYDWWYVAVPRYIPTAAGSTEYVKSGAKESGKSLNEWITENKDNKKLVDSLHPCKPQDYEHIDDAHGHPILDNTWMDKNANEIRDEGDDNKFGYELVTKPDSALSINGILYDVWRTPVTMYNKQRLNVYFNFGEQQTKETTNGLYWYIGKNKPTYNSDPLHEEGWHQLTEVPTAENPIPTEVITLDSKIFYIAIPKGFGIFNAEGVDLTNPDLEEESPYTIVYATLIDSNSYNVYITGNEASTFADKIYVKEGTDIDIDPTPDTEPDPKPEDDPQGEGDNNQYWYAGTEVPTKYNINHIANGSYLNNPNWALQSIAATNNTGESTHIYYSFPESWNVVVLDSDKVTEMSLASEGTFVYGGITYIVLKTGRKISNGTNKDYYAKCGNGSNPGGDQPGGDEPSGDQTTYYWYAGTTIPTADNLASIANGTETEKPNWNAQDVSVTNNTGNSTNIYYCFPEAWNVVILDTDKATEVALASEGTITLNNITYNIQKTGRVVSNGTVKELYAKC